MYTSDTENKNNNVLHFSLCNTVTYLLSTVIVLYVKYINKRINGIHDISEFCYHFALIKVNY